MPSTEQVASSGSPAQPPRLDANKRPRKRRPRENLSDSRSHSNETSHILADVQSDSDSHSNKLFNLTDVQRLEEQSSAWEATPLNEVAPDAQISRSTPQLVVVTLPSYDYQIEMPIADTQQAAVSRFTKFVRRIKSNRLYMFFKQIHDDNPNFLMVLGWLYFVWKGFFNGFNFINFVTVLLYSYLL